MLQQSTKLAIVWKHNTELKFSTSMPIPITFYDIPREDNLAMMELTSAHLQISSGPLKQWYLFIHLFI